MDPWTDIKLKLLRSCLHFYTQALKKQPFKLLYIDAFAGTGYRTVGSNQSGLFASERRLKGSAQIALELERPFDRYVFIEWNTRRFQVLETLRRLDAIEAFVGDRLRAAGFARVAEPLRLPLRGGAPLYSLFFWVANPKAITLSMRAADHLLKAARR